MHIVTPDDDSAARKVLVTKQRRRRSSHRRWRRRWAAVAWSALLRGSIGYGYKSWRILAPPALVVAGLAGIFKRD